MTNYCVWQVDDLQLSTSPPRRDPSLSDSIWALTPCITEGNYGKLLMLRSSVSQLLAYSGPELRLVPRL